MIRKFLLTAGLAVTAALAVPAASQAAFMVTFSVSGQPSIVIVDNGAGDTNPTANRIGFSGTIDGFNVDIDATSNSPTGGIGGARIQQNLLVTTVGGAPANPLVVDVFSDGFTLGAGPVRLTNAISESTFDPVGVATATSTISPGGTTAPATVSSGRVPDAQSSILVTNTTSPFSLSNSTTISGLQGNGSQFNGTVTTTANLAVNAVPAPSALLLGLLGVPAFGLLRRRLGVASSETAVA